MESIDNSKICYTKNLTRQNFNLLISTPVDSNANIKRIININAYVYDKKIETTFNKAIVSGKIGIKVLYIDTDNIFNTLTDSQSFSETISDPSITSDSVINLSNENLICEVLSYDGILKINCSMSFNPILYINMAIPGLDNNYDSLITKKCTTPTTYISNSIDTNIEYTCNFETKNNISKILCYTARFIPKESIASDNSIIVSGNIYSTLLYETEEDGQSILKEICETNMVKTDFAVKNMSNDQILDLSYCIDQSKNEISSEIEDNNSIITVNHTIKVCGIAMQNTTLELVDDMYSCTNELSLSFAEREFNNGIVFDSGENYITGEISINEKESAIDTIVSNTNINTEIVNSYLKDGTVVVEGIITSQLVYIDENREYLLKNTEIPFILDTKIQKEFFESKKVEISVTDCKSKAKRGTIVEFEYSINICVVNYSASKTKFIDNFTLGKSLDFSKYDYQIYLTHQNESLWELAKRICITPDELCSYNKNLPTVMTGNEKVIVKR